MEKKLKHVFRLLLPLSGEKRELFEEAASYLSKESAKDIKYWLKIGAINIEKEIIGTETLEEEEEYPQILAEKEADPELEDLVEEWNNAIEEKVQEDFFNRFSQKAGQLRELIAPNIVGMEDVKESVLLQLFADERVHILLLGDPGTGKTDVLRAAADLAPKSSFGLGSGTSGAGLTVTVQGDEIIKGLLPRAHNGLSCIDELNLMKSKDRAGLLNAMEKGFVSYDKGNKHLQVDADVKVLASANPEGDQFAGWMVDTLKKQLPFDPALLSRFHLVFLVRKPDVEEFKDITKEIVSGEQKEVSEKEKKFVQDYIEHAQGLHVKFDDKLESLVTDFVEDVKANEDKYLIDVSPRLVVGIMRLAKARARLYLRRKVEKEDVNRVIDLMESSLEIKKPEKGSEEYSEIEEKEKE